MNANQIVIGTSLAPYNIENQMQAVQSWIENGFHVVSCNDKTEMAILKESFSNIAVEFVEVKRNAENIISKKLPYIQDILDVVGNKTEAVCGFINSDIILSKVSDCMLSFLVEEAKNSFVFLRRNEINTYNDIQNLNWTIHFDGIDAFFMDKKLVKDFFDDEFYVQSMWDLCILPKCKFLGIEIKELINPVAFHKRHPIRWNFKESQRLVAQFTKKYFGVVNWAYKYVKDMWYRILYEDCKQICFCNTMQYKCLFVLNKMDGEMIENIRMQDYSNKEIVFNTDREKVEEGFDIIFYVRNCVTLSNVFCKLIVYIMDYFECDALKIGRFFLSGSNIKKYYNELNRNMDVIKKINMDCELYNYAYKNSKNKDRDIKTMYLPISYEMIDLMEDKIVDKMKLIEESYIIPAGVRACEWFAINGKNLNILGFIDNNSEKIGNQIMGKKIYSIKTLIQNPDALVIIASKYYSVDIEQQLSDELVTNRILNASYILSISSEGIVYYFNLNKYKKMNSTRNEE